MQKEMSNRQDTIDKPGSPAQISVRARTAVLIVSIVFVITVFATVAGIYFSNREISTTVSQDLMLVGKLASDMIGSSVETIKQDATYVGSMMDSAYSSGGMENLAHALASEIGPGPSFISLAVAFPDGTIVSSEKEGCAYAKPAAADVPKFLSNAPGSGVKVAEAEKTKNGQYVIRCYKSIGNGAAFIATLRGEYFSQLISKSNYGVYDAGKIFLVDGGRTMIANTGKDMLQFPHISRDETGNDLTTIVTEALSGTDTQSKIAQYIDENGTKNIWPIHL